MGEDDDLEKKAVYLGRFLEWREQGLGVRLDQRHVRSLLRELDMENCRSVTTPLSLTVEKEGDRSDRPELSAEHAGKHRTAVARVFGPRTVGFGSGGSRARQNHGCSERRRQ